MAITIQRKGFGQVEPNHLSAQRNGQIYGQLPCDSTIKILENGQFVKYNYAAGKVDFSGEGEWMLVLNEVHVYDERDRYYKDFALKASDYIEGEITPRVMKTMPGDIFTTNTFGAGNTDKNAVVATPVTLAVGDKLVVTAGFLTKETNDDNLAAAPMVWQVVKEYDMPDGQNAVKVMRIK
jgi:hypothetical protein